MATCFVIQPFDSAKFDRRFDEVYRPSIEAAGLEAYRVDRDPKAEILIDAIESGIRSAAICLADITLDNPNVWYELGFAFASGRPVVMVCSSERTTRSFPFDIQHRPIITYTPESPSDFDVLRKAIKERIAALLVKKEMLRQLQESDQVATTAGLSQKELIVLAIVAGDSGLPGELPSLRSLKSDAEGSGLTPIGFSLAFRGLSSKGLVEVAQGHWEQGEEYEGARVSDKGWSWIEANESLFVLIKPSKMAKKGGKFDDFEDDIPF
jgi:hypothetical protein